MLFPPFAVAVSRFRALSGFVCDHRREEYWLRRPLSRHAFLHALRHRSLRVDWLATHRPLLPESASRCSLFPHVAQTQLQSVGRAMIELSEGIGASPSTSGSLVSCRPSDRIFDTKVEDITEEALALPSEARALLADRLVESLDPAEDGYIHDLWVSEARARLQELRSGSVEAIPGVEAIAALRKKYAA